MYFCVHICKWPANKNLVIVIITMCTLFIYLLDYFEEIRFFVCKHSEIGKYKIKYILLYHFIIYYLFYINQIHFIKNKLYKYIFKLFIKKSEIYSFVFLYYTLETKPEFMCKQN